MEDLFWKTKSSERMRFVMLFIIRLVEIVMASFIPSIIGLILVFIKPGGRIMSAMKLLSFVAFCVMNWIFWMRYSKQRTHRREFFIINGLTYIIYAAISVAVYLLPFMGQFTYTIMFSNLRGFEPFGISTRRSLVYTHIFVMGLMVVCEIYSRIYYKALLKKLAENGADEIEMDMWKDKVPEKKDGSVKFLSVEEMSVEMENEHIEAAELLEKEAESDYEGIWDSDMTKGRGESVLRFTAPDPENDIDDGDYVADDITPNTNEEYSVDRLWNEDIYRGRTDDGKPIDDYADEIDELPDFFDVPDQSLQSEYDADEGLLWNNKMYQGRSDSSIGIEIDKSEAGDESNAILDDTPYDSENLWNKEFYRGRNTEGKINYVDDFVDEFSGMELNNFEDYDSDNLWGDITQGEKKE